MSKQRSMSREEHLGNPEPIDAIEIGMNVERDSEVTLNSEGSLI
jgi:hypothetical protein